MDLQKEAEIERPASSEPELESVATGSVSEAKLLRKIDLRLLPAVSLLYLLSFLDRSNGECFCGPEIL